jgi:hypothetical protein
MKTKLSKIFGVGLALVMVFSLAFALVPTQEAQAAEGNMQFLQQPTPSAIYNVMANGSEPIDMAVAADGMTIYIIDANGQLDGTPPFCYKSTDGGQSFLPTGFPAGGGANGPSCIAVASDNPNAIAVVENTATDIVYASNDGGTTWTRLPNLPNTQWVRDVAVSPARLGAIFGRDYAVAMSNPNTNNGTGGGLYILGANVATPTAWTPLNGNPNGTANRDYMACKFSYSYAGDWLIGSVKGDQTAGGLFLELWSTNSWLYAVPAAAGGVTQITTPAAMTDFDGWGAVNNTRFGVADLVFPIDFDVTSTAYTRVYVSWTGASGGALVGGVSRVDGPLEQSLLANHPTMSIAFAGTCYNSEGLPLFLGDFNGTAALYTQVWSTTQPTINLPTWYPSFKPATGGSTNRGGAMIAVAQDYSATLNVFAVTRGTESALSISTDAGVSFDQEAIIDNGVANDVRTIDAIQLTPDGGTIFMATDDGTHLSLWESALAVSPFSWKRIYCFPGATGMLSINKAEWADHPEIYFAETPAQPNTFNVSADGGATWANRSAPLAATAVAIAGNIGVESSKTVYVGHGTNIFKSTSGGQVWGPPIAANSGPAINSIVPAGGGHVIVGGTGGASLSTDGGASFHTLQPGLTANPYIVIPDEDYGNNNLLYAANLAAVDPLYRLDVANYASWESLANPSAATEWYAGIGMSNGTLYGVTTGAAAPAECDRTLIPHFAVGDMAWGTMVTGAPADFALADIAANKVYGVQTSTVPDGLFAYNDFLATANTTVNAPASGDTITIDPVTGRAMPVQLSWDAVGTGTGLGIEYLVAIYEKALGFPSAIIFATTNAATGAGLPLPTAPTCMIYPQGIATNAPDINYTLVGGTEYGIQICVGGVPGTTSTVSGELLTSQWSDPLFIAIEPSTGAISPTHAGPELTSPAAGDQNVDPGCGFSWNPMPGVNEYEIIIATDGALANAVAGTPATVTTTSYQAELEYSTDYYYAVRATSPTSSVQTVAAFRTMDEPVEKYTCEYCGLTFDTRAELEAHIAAAHAPTTPLYIWIVIAIGAILVIAVIWLIFTTRRA